MNYLDIDNDGVINEYEFMEQFNKIRDLYNAHKNEYKQIMHNLKSNRKTLDEKE